MKKETFDSMLGELMSDTPGKEANKIEFRDYQKYKVSYITQKELNLIFIFVTGLTDNFDNIKKELYRCKKEFLNLFEDILLHKYDSKTFKVFDPTIDSIHRNLRPKISLVGFSGVGKTTITRLIKAEEIPMQHIPTITGDIATIKIGKLYFHLWDFAGQEQFSYLWNTFIKGSDAVLLITDSSLENVEKSKFFLELIKEQAGQAHAAVIGNKQDLPEAMKPEKIEKVLGLKTYSMIAKDPANRNKMIQIIADILEMSAEISPLLKPLLERDILIEEATKSLENADFINAASLFEKISDHCIELGDDSLGKEFFDKAQRIKAMLEKAGLPTEAPTKDAGPTEQEIKEKVPEAPIKEVAPTVQEIKEKGPEPPIVPPVKIEEKKAEIVPSEETKKPPLPPAPPSPLKKEIIPAVKESATPPPPPPSNIESMKKTDISTSTPPTPPIMKAEKVNQVFTPPTETPTLKAPLPEQYLPFDKVLPPKSFSVMDKPLDEPTTKGIEKVSIPSPLKQKELQTFPEEEKLLNVDIKTEHLGLDLNPDDFIIKQRPKIVTQVPEDAKTKLKTSPFAFVSNAPSPPPKPVAPVKPIQEEKFKPPVTPPPLVKPMSVEIKPPVPPIQPIAAGSPIQKDITPPITPTQKPPEIKPPSPTPAKISEATIDKDKPSNDMITELEEKQKAELQKSLTDLKIKKANLSKLALDYDMKELTGEITTEELTEKKQKLDKILKDLNDQIKNIEDILK